MILTSQDLLAISQMLDMKLEAKLEPLEVDIHEMNNDIRSIKLDIEKALNQISNFQLEITYLPLKYEKAVPQIETMQTDIEIMKKVIAEHSEKLQRIS